MVFRASTFAACAHRGVYQGLVLGIYCVCSVQPRTSALKEGECIVTPQSVRSMLELCCWPMRHMMREL
jgi:hypothetical protein